MIELSHVTFTYGEAEEPSLTDVSLHIRPGETVVLCGESGCGKSTLTRLINGLIPHFYDGHLDGEVLLEGASVADLQLHELSERVGSVFQNPRTQFYNVDSTAELAFGCENLGIPAEQIQERISHSADRLQLHHLLDRSLFAMSGGEKQRIACGSVDTTGPEVLVLDEPSSNLDLPAIHDLQQVVRRWREDGRTIVVAEHRTFYLLDIADRFIYIHNGRVEREFTPDELRQLPPEELAGLGLRSPDPWQFAPDHHEARSRESIQLKGIECVTQGKRRLSIPELDLPRGEVIAVIGRNGAGKTTFARTLCSLEKHSTGELVIGGVGYGARKRRGLAYMVMQDVNHQLFTEDVMSEIVLSMDRHDAEENQHRAEEILTSLGLQDKNENHPMSLSGGEKQRVAIGSAIAAEREVVILDEPTSGLDYRHMVEVGEALRAMSEAGKTVFVITHDIELVLRCCSHAIYLAAGEVISHGRLDEAGEEELHAFFR